jgi:hypothetical protein
MSLRAKLIRLAHAKPELREVILPLLREASDKTAASPETELFISWVIATQKPMSPNTVERFLESKLGRTPTEAAEKAPAKRGPLEKGESVLIDAYKNTNAANVDAAKQYHNRVGFVEDISGEGVTIAFYEGDADRPSKVVSGDKQFFDGKVTGKTTGLYRWTSRVEHQEHSVEKRLGFEMVYFAEKPNVDKRSLEQIQKFVEKGVDKGESRDRAYFTGQVGTFAYNKSGEMYFSLVTPQRDRPTYISPAKGQLLYIGVLGHRPGGWLRDAEEIVETEAMSAAEAQAAE